MSSDDTFVRVYRAANVTEAHVIRGLLEQYDIRVQLIGENLSSGFGELPAEVVEVEIRVPVFYSQLAKELVREYELTRTSDFSPGPEWQCKECGEKNPETFGICWNCNAAVSRN